MSARNYGQACSVANFLDRLGGRWTLLIIRDLLIGPRRYKDLLEGLPGIGTNLLARRLRELQDLEIIEKSTDTNNAGIYYVLTEKGLALEPVIVSMAVWGMQHLHADYADKLNRPDLLVVAFRAAFNAEQAVGINESYELRIGDTVFHAHVHNGKLSTGLGTADHPALVYITDTETFGQLAFGELSPASARESGVLDIIGDESAFQRFLRIFSAPDS